jgi:predicted nucleic acid-binding protein
VAKSREPVAVDIPDASDRWVLTAAVDGKAHVLITGDRDLLELRESVPIAIVDPRGFWTMLSRGRPD